MVRLAVRQVDVITAKQRLRAAAVDAYHKAMPAMIGRLGVGIASRPRFLTGQRLLIIQCLGLVTVLDVGANVGQYALELRRSGYGGDIHSFEPGAEALAALKRAADHDPRWFVYGTALADRTGQQTLSTWPGAQSVRASLLAPDAHLVAALGTPAREAIEVTTLAEWLGEHSADPTKALLKVDVQGSEREVFQGAGPHLGEFAAVEFEASIRPTYEGEAQISELIGLIEAAGFACASIETDRFSAEGLGADEVDVLAVRRDLLQS
jgi:FkbM family methyltransferase